MNYTYIGVINIFNINKLIAHSIHDVKITYQNEYIYSIEGDKEKKISVVLEIIEHELSSKYKSKIITKPYTKLNRQLINDIANKKIQKIEFESKIKSFQWLRIQKNISINELKKIYNI